MSKFYKPDGTRYRNKKTKEAVIQWGEDYGKKENKIIKQQYNWYGAFISTVWLGIDHNFIDNSKHPLIFETMVFYKKWTELDIDRYSTKEEAIAGHNKIVKKWKNPIYLLKFFLNELKYKLK